MPLQVQGYAVIRAAAARCLYRADSAGPATTRSARQRYSRMLFRKPIQLPAWDHAAADCARGDLDPSQCIGHECRTRCTGTVRGGRRGRRSRGCDNTGPEHRHGRSRWSDTRHTAGPERRHVSSRWSDTRRTAGPERRHGSSPAQRRIERQQTNSAAPPMQLLKVIFSWETPPCIEACHSAQVEGGELTSVSDRLPLYVRRSV